MERCIGNEVSYRMLSATLKELAADNLVIRTAYDEKYLIKSVAALSDRYTCDSNLNLRKVFRPLG